MIDFIDIHANNFNEEALKLFQFQAKNVSVYKNYLKNLNIDIDSIISYEEIPFLPIQFFKSHQVILDGKKPEITFLSSGTSSMERSKHLISDVSVYEKSFVHSFKCFYENFQDYAIQALLPSYLENENSSLIYMIDYFIEHSKEDLSGFVSKEELIRNISTLRNKKVLLIGVSYALLDLAESKTLDLSNYIIMETGGMKGRRKEWTRSELHKVYKNSFNSDTIHSEYGMTELLSQAYSKGKGIFKTPAWMKILSRPLNAPFSIQKKNETGVLKIIDLANRNSCAFIETADMGRVFADGSFEVIGRVDFEAIRGCNLMIS